MPEVTDFIVSAVLIGAGAAAMMDTWAIVQRRLQQPGMGLGITAHRTPRPNAARLRSLRTHTVFRIGLYPAALCVSVLRM